jgi:hypothetical protein
VFSAAARSTAVRFDGVFRLPVARQHEQAGQVLTRIGAAESGAGHLLNQVAETLISDDAAEALWPAGRQLPPG